ncbi:zinc-binding dehydrogenase [Fictibacillus arsenicus]
MSNGKITPVIERTFPLEQAREAQTHFKNAGKLGKIILLPKESVE